VEIVSQLKDFSRWTRNRIALLRLEHGIESTFCRRLNEIKYVAEVTSGTYGGVLRWRPEGGPVNQLLSKSSCERRPGDRLSGRKGKGKITITKTQKNRPTHLRNRG
jgi:hypothetical protein